VEGAQAVAARLMAWVPEGWREGWEDRAVDGWRHDVPVISGLMAPRVPLVVAEQGRTRSCFIFMRRWPGRSGR
jgi:hypothetical protein